MKISFWVIRHKRSKLLLCQTFAGELRTPTKADMEKRNGRHPAPKIFSYKVDAEDAIYGTKYRAKYHNYKDSSLEIVLVKAEIE